MPASPPSVLSVAILCQLLVAPRSGYDLKRAFERTAMGHFSSSPGAIYPALQRLEKDGLISGRVDDTKPLRVSRVYRLSKKGVGVLKELFESPLTREDIVHRMDVVMLRFAFMTPLVGRSATLSFLENLTGQLEAYVVELRHQAGQLGDVPLEGMLALRHGIETYNARLKWTRSALRELQAATQ